MVSFTWRDTSQSVVLLGTENIWAWRTTSLVSVLAQRVPKVSSKCITQGQLATDLHVRSLDSLIVPGHFIPAQVISQYHDHVWFWNCFLFVFPCPAEERGGEHQYGGQQPHGGTDHSLLNDVDLSQSPLGPWFTGSHFTQSGQTNLRPLSRKVGPDLKVNY